MRSPEFEAMIAPARHYPALWRVICGLLLIVFVYLGVVGLIAGGALAVMGNLFRFLGWMQGLSEPTDPVTVLVLLLTFLGMFLGPLLAAAAFHFRGPGSLFGPASETLRGFVVTLAAAAPLYVVILVATSVYDPAVPNLAVGEWLKWLPLALPLLMLQVTSEELLFRGYLQTQLAARFQQRFWWMFLPSALFALLHWNPDAGPSLGLVLVAPFAFGLIAADLTEKTGSLGAAIGLHFINNFFGLLIISIPGTITGLALWVTPFGLEDHGVIAVSLALNVVFLVVVWHAVLWALDY
jgi:uncharacterized protein